MMADASGDTVHIALAEYESLQGLRSTLMEILSKAGGPGGDVTMREALRDVLEPQPSPDYARQTVTWDPPSPITIPVPTGGTITHATILDGASAMDDDVAVPEGWPAASSDPVVVRQQYADAAERADDHAKAISRSLANWREMTIKPTAEASLLIHLSMVLQVAAAELMEWDPECVTCEPKVSRTTARMVRELYEAGMAQIFSLASVTAAGIESLGAQGSFETLSKLVSNLHAAGLDFAAGQVRTIAENGVEAW